VVLCGRRALGRGGTWIDPMMSLQKVAIHGLPWARVCLVGEAYSFAGLFIDSDLRNALRDE
jgi:hypothetical protein